MNEFKKRAVGKTLTHKHLNTINNGISSCQSAGYSGILGARPGKSLYVDRHCGSPANESSDVCQYFANAGVEKLCGARGQKKGYRLGPMAYNLTNNPSYNQNLVSAAKDVMEELTSQLNETSLLGILRNHKRFILHLVNSDQDLQVRSRSERNVYETASGRVLLAYLTPKEQENFILVNGLPAEDIWQEAASREGLENALSKIKKNELAITYSKTHIIGLAVPIKKRSKSLQH